MPPSGYQNGIVSGTYVGWIDNGARITRDGGGTFTFNSVHLTAAWRDGLHVTVQGWLGGSLAQSRNLVLDTSGPSFQVFNWPGPWWPD